jgi:hypothetical protein
MHGPYNIKFEIEYSLKSEARTFYGFSIVFWTEQAPPNELADP